MQSNKQRRIGLRSDQPPTEEKGTERGGVRGNGRRDSNGRARGHGLKVSVSLKEDSPRTKGTLIRIGRKGPFFARHVQ